MIVFLHLLACAACYVLSVIIIGSLVYASYLFFTIQLWDGMVCWAIAAAAFVLFYPLRLWLEG